MVSSTVMNKAPISVGLNPTQNIMPFCTTILPCFGGSTLHRTLASLTNFKLAYNFMMPGLSSSNLTYLAYPALSCSVLSCITLPYPAMSCPVILSPALPFLSFFIILWCPYLRVLLVLQPRCHELSCTTGTVLSRVESC